MATTKAEILSAIRREAAANGGEPLGQAKFETATGIRAHEWKGVYWARWNDALAEAGFSGREWGNVSPFTEMSAEDAAAWLAALTRELGRFPTDPELRLRKRNDSATPHPSVFKTRLGNVAAQRAAVFNWASEHSGWEDVAEIVRPLLTTSAATVKPGPGSVVIGYVYLFKSGEYYKVGRSNSVGRRSYEVALQLPERVETLHAIETDDPEGIEAYWHRRFAATRANGEWFKLSADDIAAFQRRRYQ